MGPTTNYLIHSRFQVWLHHSQLSAYDQITLETIGFSIPVVAYVYIHQ